MKFSRIAPVLAAIAILAAACGSSTDEAAVADVPEAITAPEPAVEEPEEPVVEEVEPEEPVVEEDAPRTATASAEATFGEEFPDIVGAEAIQDDSGAWRFNVTVSSPYDTPQRYADAWRVLDPEGNELGIRVLAHDHANEQPFTRSQSGIQIPSEVSEVTIQGRDLANGWGGGELTLAIP